MPALTAELPTVNAWSTFAGGGWDAPARARLVLANRYLLPDYYEDNASDGKSLFELLVADPERAWAVDETIARAREQVQPRFVPGSAAYYFSDTNFQLLGKIIEAVTAKPLGIVFDELLFRPPGLTHTWLVGRSQPEIAPTAAVAEVFYNGANITTVRANPAFWVDGGIVSTTGDLIRFPKGSTQV